MEKLINYLEKYYDRKLVPTELDENEQQELDFLESFVDEFDINDQVSVLGFDPKKFLLASLLSCNDYNNFEFLKEKVYKLNNRFFTNTNYDEIARINNLIVDFGLDEKLGLIRKLSYSDIEDEENEIVEELKEDGLYEKAKNLYSLLKKYTGNDEEQRELIFDFCNEYYSVALVVLNAIATIKSTAEALNFRKKVKVEKKKNTNTNVLNFDPTTLPMIASFEALSSNMEEEFSPDTFNDKESRKAFKKILDVSNVTKSYNSIMDRISFLKSLPNQRAKENNSNKRKKEKLITQLKSFDLSKPIVLSRIFVESITDERIKYFILKIILKHNLEFHLETEKELEKEKEISVLEKLFKKSCFSFNDLSEEQKKNLLFYGNISNIEKILNLFTESNIHFNDNFPIYDILLLSKPIFVSTILKLISANYITEAFVINTPEIFVNEISEELIDKANIKEGKYDRLVDNINILDDNKFDTLNISKKEKSILLMDSEELRKSINLVKLYGLDYSKGNNYDLIKNKKLIIIADKYIELGLRSYLKKHPNIVSNKSNTRLNRIELCRLLGIPVLVDGKLNSKITDQEFRYGKNVIADIDILEYVPNSTNRYLNEDCYKLLLQNDDYTNYESEIELLEPYKVSESEYNIDGIIISRNKVLRNYNCLIKNEELSKEDIIFNSVIFNSTLDDDQIETIVKLIYKKDLKELKLN